MVILTRGLRRLSGICLALTFAYATSGCDSVTGNPGVMKIRKGLKLSPVDEGALRPIAPIDLGGRLWLTRAEPTWQFKEVMREPWGDAGDVLAYEISGAFSQPVRWHIEPSKKVMTEEEVRIGFGSLLGGEPDITISGFLREYGTDRDYAEACAVLPTGDPALGGKRLSEEEQGRCVLVALCMRDFLGAVPTRVQGVRMTAFISARERRDATGVAYDVRLWPFEDGDDSGRYMHLSVVGGVGTHDCSSGLELANFAAKLLVCLGMGNPG